MTDRLPVSVVVPTIGRPANLEACLASLRACIPRAEEILVVDQSGRTSIADTVMRYSDLGARLIRCEGRGAGRARNRGLLCARREVVLFTDDDCCVSDSWVGTAWRLMTDDPDRIVSGRVLALGDPRRVPSTKDERISREYEGRARADVLFSGNMASRRSTLLEFGGFDGLFTTAEDVDLCFRWLRSGRRISYEPVLVVWHTDWRTEEQLQQLCVEYWRGGGFFLAKHLRQRDFRVIPFLFRDVQSAGRSLANHLLGRRRFWSDGWLGFCRGYVSGLVSGWRAFAPETNGAEAAQPTPGDRLRDGRHR